MISIKLQSNFIEIKLRHWCYPVNLLQIFRTPFSKGTSGGLVLSFAQDEGGNRFCEDATHSKEHPFNMVKTMLKSLSLLKEAWGLKWPDRKLTKL